MHKNPKLIRVSIGSATCLGLTKMKLDAYPTTAYLMLYHEGKCVANCAFCSQARESRSKSDRLSRIQWPDYGISKVLVKFKKLNKTPIKRICIQALNYPHFNKDILYLVKELKKVSSLPISLSCHPINEKTLYNLHKLGIDRIGIPFDVANPELFRKIKGKDNKGPYSWEKHQNYLEIGKKILGSEKITVHLIVGLGESEYDDIAFIQEFWNMGVKTGLFAFTPLRGTKLENYPRPKIGHYRRVQLARYIIIYNHGKLESMKFNKNNQLIDFGLSREKLNFLIEKGIPFQTSGCPNCNRPYYNERPGKKLFNYPKPLTDENIRGIHKDLGDYS
ncbi:MAG: radical SAM protein [Candidatus Lokiarchaeota archaeon]|nr:radical SAM protein [Candidatus Lokiarchaeota archaeon]